MNPPETVDPLSILNEGRTLDFFHEGKIVRMRHVETRGNYELFVIREYRTDASYQRYEYRFIEPGFMDSYPDLPTEVTGQMVERYEYYKLTGGSNGRHIFYLVGEIGRIKSAEIPFVKRFPRDPDAMVWEKID